MRRPGPRPLAPAIQAAARAAAPLTTLARAQECWPQVAGEALAAEAEPVSERGGILTFRCDSAIWAQELDLLSQDLLERLNQALGGGPGGGPLTALRFRSGSALRKSP